MSIKTSKLWITSIALTLTLAVAAQAQTKSSAAGTSSDSTAITLEQAQNLVIGKWKVNWEETKKSERFRKFASENPELAPEKTELRIEFTESELIFSGKDTQGNKQEQKLNYKLTEHEKGEEELPEYEFYAADIPGTETRHGKITIEHSTRLTYQAFKGIPYPVVLDQDVPATAKKLDIDGGDFIFGYSTNTETGFHKFSVPNTPFNDKNIKRLSKENEKDWFSFTQNIGSAASDPSVTENVYYPGKDEGSGVLHPGKNAGDVAKARFTAKSAGVYRFDIETKLIHAGCKGAGVKIYKGDQVLYQTLLEKHMKPWIISFNLRLETDETVDIAVDSGENDDYSTDHVLITESALLMTGK